MDSTTVRMISGLLALLCLVPIAMFVKYVIENRTPPPGSVGFLRDEACRHMATVRDFAVADRESVLTRLNTEFATLLASASNFGTVEELRKHLELVANQRQAIASDSLRRSQSPGADPGFVAIRLYELTASALLSFNESGDMDARELVDEVVNFVQMGLPSNQQGLR